MNKILTLGIVGYLCVSSPYVNSAGMCKSLYSGNSDKLGVCTDFNKNGEYATNFKIKKLYRGGVLDLEIKPELKGKLGKKPIDFYPQANATLNFTDNLNYSIQCDMNNEVCMNKLNYNFGDIFGLEPQDFKYGLIRGRELNGSEREKHSVKIVTPNNFFLEGVLEREPNEKLSSSFGYKKDNLEIEAEVKCNNSIRTDGCKYTLGISFDF